MGTMTQVVRRGWKRAVGSIVTLFVLSASLLPGIALASPGYPYYKYEGSYPTATPCSGHYFLPDVKGGATRTATYKGRTITLKYYYNSRCGSFARIENTPSGLCTVWLDRSNDGGKTWDATGEHVEPGMDYAYTKVGSNLNGRVSRAALVCEDGKEPIARTNWY